MTRSYLKSIFLVLGALEALSQTAMLRGLRTVGAKAQTITSREASVLAWLASLHCCHYVHASEHGI